MSSLESSKSFHGSEKCSRQHRASGLRPKIPSSQVEDSVVKKSIRKRVWKACERCKIKKIKCDAGAPCKRCKEDGIICITGSRRKTEFTSIPRGYAEVLENTHFALIATVEKLYFMLRNGESWELDDPEMNDHGMPIIHDVAKMLGCIRESQDDAWAWPERADDIPELKARISMAQRDHIEDEQKALSGDHRLSLECEGFSSPSQDSETPFTPVEAAMADPLVQQEDWSLSQKPSSPEYQELQQKPDIILPDALMQETQVEISNQPFFPMDSPHYRFSEPQIDMFDTRGSIAPFASDLPMEALDWTFWSDTLA